ncbi:ATP-dependent protease La [Bellilinea caldifistulae]|uniref:endopeptidase La n=1 Tax=Bellilinea caldifistulae TaxID=360411 RepID=UPI0009E1B16F|nr:endopeptidase La [Bellilinea caldifistulae]GAP10885.1 ATP-dependent protease La [Bellilinea caldifistulae]
MPASRWNIDFNQFYFQFDAEEEGYEEVFLSSDEGEEEIFIEEPIATQPESNQPEEIVKLPEILPILPLRGLVVYPQTGVPLTIGQPRSIRLVDDVVTGDRFMGLVASKHPEIESPDPEHLYKVGTAGLIHRMFRAPDGTIRLLVQGLFRFRIIEFVATEPYLKARIEVIPEKQETGLEVEALARNVRDQFAHIAEMIPSMPRELVATVTSITDPLQTVYTIANLQRMDIEDAQEILELDSITDKLHKLVTLLTRESEVLELSQKIQKEARSEIDKVQREYFLREQLKAIQRELGETDEQAADVEEFRKKIEESGMSEEARKLAQRELDRLSRLPTAAAEYGVIRTFLDWLVSLPWSKTTPDNLDIAHAREVLDQDHYGLEDIKERILEYLAIRKLRLDRAAEFAQETTPDVIRRQREGVILCFIGPPGVGKTSLGQSISRAMGRKFVRISLGGVRDEAEIRGHRRTYIGAMPGRIIQALRRVETRNPVFMLDEIDKLSFDFRGDPASALLEVLDPEQNQEFRDNYIEVAFDLSQVMFITTANQMETIPGPLLDRMEIIQLSGYTDSEKFEIAKRYLIPRQLKENSLRQDEIEFTPKALTTIIRHYTREAGVRNLEREIGSICRKVATKITEGKITRQVVDENTIREFLGRPKYLGTEEIQRRTEIPGVATGLAWTPVGGDVLFIEATIMPGSKGFITTGSVGKVMQESAQAALSYVRSRAAQLGIDPNIFEKSDIHLHIPAGAQPKDGPSAGVTMATALVSLLTGRLVRSDVGMTGEITLRGQVLPVGGIKEKVLAAHRAGLKTVILPKGNEADLEDLPEEVHNAIQFILVERVDEVLEHALEQKVEQPAQV